VLLWRDRICAVEVHDRGDGQVGRRIANVEGYDVCAVRVHDRQDSRTGQRTAVGSRE
jgi:hypothetical protein